MRLTIVDLAGAERNKRAKNNAKRLKESNAVNLSLSVLRKCFDALKLGKRVPFRDNKLTHFLKEYFDENKKIIMIVNINPSQADFEETLQVLEYGNIAKKIEAIKSRVDSRKGSEHASRRRRSTLPNLVRASLDKQIEPVVVSRISEKKSRATKSFEMGVDQNIEKIVRCTVKREWQKICQKKISEEIRKMSEFYSEELGKKLREDIKKMVFYKSESKRKGQKVDSKGRRGELARFPEQACGKCKCRCERNLVDTQSGENYEIGKKRMYTKSVGCFELGFRVKEQLDQVGSRVEEIDEKVSLQIERSKKMIKQNKKEINKNKKLIRENNKKNARIRKLQRKQKQRSLFQSK